MAKTISINLEAGTAAFIANIDKAGGSLDQFGKHAGGASEMYKHFMEGLGIGSGIEIAHKGMELLEEGIEKVKHGFEEVGEIGRSSIRLGISPEEFSRLKYAAEVTHVSAETMEADFGKMLNSLAKAGEKGGETGKVFERLGLDVAELKNAQPSEAFEKIAEAIAHVQNRAERMNDVREIFGRAGTAILPMIEHMRELKQESDDVGFTRTAEEVKQVEEAEMEMARATKQAEAAFMNLAANVAPALKTVYTWLVDVKSGIQEITGVGSQRRRNAAEGESERDIHEANRARLEEQEVMGDSIRAYEKQTEYVDALKRALKDLATVESEAAAQHDHQGEEEAAQKIQDVKDGLRVAVTIQQSLKEQSEAAKEANEQAKRELEDYNAEFVRANKEFEQEMQRMEREKEEAAKSQENRLSREMEAYRRLTEDPALRKYQDQLEALDDLKAHGRITDAEYAAAVGKAQSEMDKAQSKGHGSRQADAVQRMFDFRLAGVQESPEKEIADQTKKQTGFLEKWDVVMTAIWNNINGLSPDQNAAAVLDF